LFALLSLGLGLGCSLILNPANKDDVVRCTNTADCSEDEGFNQTLNADYRLTARCSSNAGGGGGDIGQSSGDQVCSAIYDTAIGCNGSNTSPLTHPFRVAYDEAIKADYYQLCASEHLGLPGCRPCSSALNLDDSPQCDNGSGENKSKCVDGSEADDATGVCSGDGPWPTYPANAKGPSDDSLEGQDVLDQYCRSFFCDEDFVCDRDTFKCIKCDPEGDYGEGGCGDLYVNGARSTVYQDQDTLESRCSKSTPKSEASLATEFGPIPSGA
jgi:hypothetical protein